jgi:ribokinase
MRFPKLHVSRPFRWLILITLAAALAAAHMKGEGSMARVGEMPTTALVVGVGAGVADVGVPNARGVGEKATATITFTGGGGAFNAILGAHAFGAQTALISLVGPDHLGSAVLDIMRDGLPCVFASRVLEQTRMSVVFSNRSYVQRHGVRRPLSPTCEGLIRRRADVLLVAPFRAADYAFVARVLALAGPRAYRVLMLSKEQAGAYRSLNLMRGAELVVLGRTELHAAAGTDDLEVGIVRLAEQGVRSLVVTAGGEGAAARIDGSWLDQGAFQVRRVSSTVKAGDTFTGILAGALAANHTIPEALQVASAGAAFLVERGRLPSRRELLQFAGERREGPPPLLTARRAQTRGRRRARLWHAFGYGAAAAVGATLSTVFPWSPLS